MRASATGLLAAGVASRALAQAVKKPVHMIVGFPAGGGTDVTARVLAESLRGPYASTVLVENKPGASARLAVEYVKNAEPDGSVMLFTPDFPMTLYPHSFKSLSYDPLQDFTPVGAGDQIDAELQRRAGGAGQRQDARATSCEWCKANPTRRPTAPPRPAPRRTSPASCWRTRPRCAINPVHYRGGAPALQDVVGGHMPRASIRSARHAAAQGRHDAHPGGDRREALAVPARRADHAGAGYDVVVDSWLGVFLPPRRRTTWCAR